MKYIQPTFTLPTSNNQMTQEEYEIAVGTRCVHCKKKFVRSGVREGFLKLEGLICGCNDRSK